MLALVIGLWQFGTTKPPQVKPAIKPPVKVQAKPVPNERASRQVGVWVMTMFDRLDKFQHWSDVRWRKAAEPLEGAFSCSDPDYVARTYQAIRKAGIDYILLDDTNTLFVDDGLIDKAVKAWFDYADSQLGAQRIPIAIAAGGELNQHGNPDAWHQASAYLFQKYAYRMSYLRSNGKPVLYWYIEKDVEPNWTDPRWTIRKTFHFFRTEDSFRNGGWGYGSSDITRPEGLQCASIQPGWDLSAPGSPRNGGETYANRWCKSIGSNAKSVLLSDWNGWNEGTALTESNSWQDSYGAVSPSWYLDMTKGFVQLFKGKVVDGLYYRLDGSPDVFLYTKGKFIYQGEFPHLKPIIVVPAGHIKGFPPIR
jgi:hypothetical protein